MSRASHVVQDPPLAKVLFDHPLAGWLWVLPRIWLGWQWVQASEHKISDPAWVQTGAALKGFWAGAVAIPATGKPAISFVWYRSFLEMLLNAQAYTWFAKVVAYGELLIGVALIVGGSPGSPLSWAGS